MNIACAFAVWLRFARVAVFAVATLVLCSGCEDGDNGGGFGPCTWEFREPLFTIVSANDAATRLPITTVIMTNPRYEGQPIAAGALLWSMSYGVQAQGDTLVCQVPCGFGLHEGNYVITFSAPGYVAQDRGYQAVFSQHVGNCPGYSDGGLRLSLSLQTAEDGAAGPGEPTRWRWAWEPLKSRWK